MRKSPILEALFPDIRAKVLAALLIHPEKPWYLTELAVHLGTKPSSLQREVEALSKAGILEQWRDGRRAYFKADTSSPVFSDLSALLEKTAGVVPILQQELAPLGERVQLAFLYGSIARSQETSESDVDLMVVGTAGLSDLIPSLRRAEQALSRLVNPTVFSPEEFRRKAKHHDHFLSAVLQAPKTFVKGGERELETMAG